MSRLGVGYQSTTGGSLRAWYAQRAKPATMDSSATRRTNSTATGMPSASGDPTAPELAGAFVAGSTWLTTDGVSAARTEDAGVQATRTATMIANLPIRFTACRLVRTWLKSILDALGKPTPTSPFGSGDTSRCRPLPLSPGPRMPVSPRRGRLYPVVGEGLRVKERPEPASQSLDRGGALQPDEPEAAQQGDGSRDDGHDHRTGQAPSASGGSLNGWARAGEWRQPWLR